MDWFEKAVWKAKKPFQTAFRLESRYSELGKRYAAMKKTWNQILESAQPVVDFLSSDSFFSRPYDGDREKFIVTTSPEEARYLLSEYTHSIK